MSETLKVIQLTDIHMFSDEEGTLAGLNTNDSFDAILVKLKSNKFHQADVILITGDLIQDNLPSSYKKLADKLKDIDIPIYWLPGNHDIANIYQGDFKGNNIKNDKVIDFDDWRIILLNSVQWGQVNGLFSDEQKDFLRSSLDSSSKNNIMIGIHHPPFYIKSEWLNNVGLINIEDFWDVINNDERVKCILSGHIHQSTEQEVNGIKVFSTPSTCIQFATDSNTFALDEKQPGYRYLELHPNGLVYTIVYRLNGFNLNLDKNIKGY